MYQCPSHGEIRRRMTLFRLDILFPYSFKLRVIYKTSLEVREPRPFVITRFKTVVPTFFWLFPTERDETTWLPNRLRQLSYCADHSRLYLSLSSSGAECCPALRNELCNHQYICYFQELVFSQKIKFHAFYALWGCFVFLLLELNKLL